VTPTKFGGHLKKSGDVYLWVLICSENNSFLIFNFLKNILKKEENCIILWNW
jgi:hypothetical protein